MSRFSTRKGKTPTNARKIKDDKGIVYNSLTEAGKQFPNPDVARRSISDVCRGLRTDYRGIKFKFITYGEEI